MILCEQCGNEFNRGRKIETDSGKKMIECPYCKWRNPFPTKRNKKNKDWKNRK